MTKSSLLSLLLFPCSFCLFAQHVNQYDTQGQRQGLWIFYHDAPKNTQIKLTGRFENGREVDTFKYYIPRIQHPMSIRIYDAPKSCYAFFYDKDRQLIAEGRYDTLRKKDGKWCYYDKSKNLSAIENFAHGKKDQASFVFFDNGKIVEHQTYRNGFKYGLYERFSDKNFVLEKINFYENLRHGEAFFYDLEGNISIRGDYKHGVKDGVWRYYKDGKVDRTEDYTPAGRKRKKMAKRRKRKEKKSSQEVPSDTTSALDWIKSLNSKNTK